MFGLSAFWCKGEKQWLLAEYSSTSAVFSNKILIEAIDLVVAEKWESKNPPKSIKTKLTIINVLQICCSCQKKVLLNGLSSTERMFSAETMVEEIIPVVTDKNKFV